jgi:hypothetical protein
MTPDVRGILSEEEWQELVTLDYILTWNYTTDYERDLNRYQELSERRWKSLENRNDGVSIKIPL